MGKLKFIVAVWLACLFMGADLGAQAQQSRARRSRGASAAESRLNGVYRIDPSSSDKLYSVVANATSNIPFGEQQRFFIDLTIRLTPPDQLAIERRGKVVGIASTRAPRITFEADGVTRAERASGSRTVRTRAVIDGDKLEVSGSGNGEDNYSINFDPIDGGRRLRVTRRIYAEQLSQPVVIQSIYNKISDVARWDIYGEPETASTEQTASAGERPAPDSTAAASRERDRSEGSERAIQLRVQLDEWIEATNRQNMRKQMSFYAPTLAAFYLLRNVSRDFVRAEKERTINRASKVDIQAAAPEIVFLDEDTAVMRFRKRYAVEGRQNRRGEVVQELRWRRTNGDWKIFSERDVRVIR